MKKSLPKVFRLSYTIKKFYLFIISRDDNIVENKIILVSPYSAILKIKDHKKSEEIPEIWLIFFMFVI